MAVGLHRLEVDCCVKSGSNSTMVPQKKRHHFIPIAYLNGFTDNDGKVIAYRKDDVSRPLRLKPSEIAFERYYYSQPLPDGGRDNNTLEDLFSTIESAWPPMVQRMRERANINAELSTLFEFIGMMRVRVPAVRDMVEASLSETVMAELRLLDRFGELPSPPDGLEDILSMIEVAIDPHQSIHAMIPLVQEFARIADRLGLQIVHNKTDVDFVTSDNPVIYFNPEVSEAGILPYTVDPEGPVELFLPIDRRTALRGHSRNKWRFATHGVEHVELGSRDEVKRINRLVARFGYRFVFAADRAHERLVAKYAAYSPVLDVTGIQAPDGELIVRRMVFGPRRKKPKWDSKKSGE